MFMPPRTAVSRNCARATASGTLARPAMMAWHLHVRNAYKPGIPLECRDELLLIDKAITITIAFRKLKLQQLLVVQVGLRA
jgi:hypothetical protein